MTKGTTVVLERIEKMKIYALFELFMRKGYKKLGTNYKYPTNCTGDLGSFFR